MNLNLPQQLDRARLSQLDFEQLVDIVIEQANVTQQLQTTINELKQDIERLRVSKNLDSKTSSKPPIQRLTSKTRKQETTTRLMNADLKANTVNRYLSAIKYLVEWGRRLDLCQFVYDSAVIKKEKVKPYRDTTGVDVDTYNQVFDVIDIATPRGKRDYALFLLLWTNVLRRGEIAKLLVRDFDTGSSKLRVFGKGKGVEIEWKNLRKYEYDDIILKWYKS